MNILFVRHCIIYFTHIGQYINIENSGCEMRDVHVNASSASKTVLSSRVVSFELSETL